MKCFSSMLRTFSNPACARRHFLRQLGDRLRRAHAGDDVFALRVDQELAVELLGAVGRVARERHARAGVLAGVAVDHRLHVDGRAPFLRDVVFPAINDRAIVHPRAENGAGRALKLILRIVRKGLPGAFFHQRLEADHQLLVIAATVSFVGDIVLAVSLVFVVFDSGFKGIVIFAFAAFARP